MKTEEITSAKKSRLPIIKLFPSIITLVALCLGLTSMKYTFKGRWELAVIFILFASFLDFVDGKIARLLGTASLIGAHLDSLADVINFGVAPALLVYFWILNTVKVFGWGSVMLFVICMTIRLARFNISLHATEIDNEIEASSKKMSFFSGVPAPAGAILALAPVILSFEYLNESSLLEANKICIYLVIVSLLIVSTIPTFSTKTLKIDRKFIPMSLAIFSIIFISLITKPWIVMPVILAVYILMIPISIVIFFYKEEYPGSKK